MIRTLSMSVALSVLVAGCGRPSSPSFAKYDLNGGRYFVDIENTVNGTERKAVPPETNST